ncbi:LamB/YcsF family protein [Alteromonas aestuariivivens]|uniref:LamB/YcsF family protein n=1 Tax=Alteromonas aestuariivivens TaxID=1938339 RepID=A0A3D8MAW4_9ALTE|nr:5-oxoprolinase subunit PxpA [Alteromonas aestuariivivens]RDV27398.1 LamB/YcsF family protein [Alteromonas aestuariivivens]
MMLNCDLGEGFGAWTMPVDEQIMVYIDQANIACGFHAGDPLVLQNAIGLAKRHNVAVGAHPSYPDLQGFGRRSMNMAADELKACLLYQISALWGMAKCQGVELAYVKPHGALYNDLMKNAEVRNTVMEAVAEFSEARLPLMIQAHPRYPELQQQANTLGLVLWFEAFVDRRYTDDGYLMSRRLEGAVLSFEQAIGQAVRMLNRQEVVTESGNVLQLPIDTLCVHGDSPDAVGMAAELRKIMTKAKLGQAPSGNTAL